MKFPLVEEALTDQELSTVTGGHGGSSTRYIYESDYEDEYEYAYGYSSGSETEVYSSDDWDDDWD